MIKAHARMPIELQETTTQAVPESALQSVPDVVMKQRLGGQMRAPRQVGLQVRRHLRLASDYRLQPSGRGLARHCCAQPEPFGMTGAHGVPEGYHRALR